MWAAWIRVILASFWCCLLRIGSRYQLLVSAENPKQHARTSINTCHKLLLQMWYGAFKGSYSEQQMEIGKRGDKQQWANETVWEID